MRSKRPDPGWIRPCSIRDPYLPVPKRSSTTPPRSRSPRRRRACRGRTATCCSASSSRSQGHRVEEKGSPPAGAHCLPVFHCPTAIAVFGIAEQFARNGSAKIACMAGNWRKRAGVEPTRDRMAAPPGFEDRAPHRGTISSMFMRASSQALRLRDAARGRRGRGECSRCDRRTRESGSPLCGRRCHRQK
jgi:hypothetical protein